jgi:hypothetical protein
VQALERYFPGKAAWKFVIFTSSYRLVKKFTTMKKLILLIVAIAVTAFCLNAQDAQTVINNAIKSLGATDLKTIEYSGSGYVFSFGQNPNPTMPWPKFNAKSYTKGINYQSGSYTQRLVRTQAENSSAPVCLPV